MFQQRPALAAELLSGSLEFPLPDWRQARLDSAELSDVTIAEYRADAVVTLADAGAHGDRPVLAVVVEVQLSLDAGKRWSWPAYVTNLRARLKCPTILLVICPNEAVAHWCTAPIDCGQQRLMLWPLVIGPDRIPMIIDEGQARRDPELAVLSMLAHASHPEWEKAFHATWVGLVDADEQHTTMYCDVVLAALPVAARSYLEEFMTSGTYEYQTEFVRRYVHQGRAEGRVEGEAKAVLAVLAARGIDVPEAARGRITGCTDLEQLDVWVRRATTANSVHDLFDH